MAKIEIVKKSMIQTTTKRNEAVQLTNNCVFSCFVIDSSNEINWPDLTRTSEL